MSVYATPAWRSDRARKAARASHHPDTLIRRLAKMAEDLTDEQRGALIRIATTPRRPA